MHEIGVSVIAPFVSQKVRLLIEKIIHYKKSVFVI
jgi:hypothetical protein